MARMDTPALDRLRIATPCPASWHDMHGDDRSRRCDHCRLQVFNLSGMTREEAETLMAERTGKARTCLHFFKRRDGTVLTKDCPRGVADRWRYLEVRVLALCAALLGAGLTDYAHGGPTHQALSPALQAVSRFLRPEIHELGLYPADETIDTVDSNL